MKPLILITLVADYMNCNTYKGTSCISLEVSDNHCLLFVYSYIQSKEPMPHLKDKR